VQRVTVHERSVPGLGKIREMQTEAGDTVVVVVHAGGGCEVSVRRDHDDAVATAAVFTDAEAVALAAMVTGALVSAAVDEGGVPPQ
jgi:K+/H+ antiporter YhaU regulatory subunit KhtT